MVIYHQSQAPLVDNVKYSNLSGDTLLLVSEKTVVFFPEVPSQINEALCGKSWDIQGSFKPGHSSTDLHFTLRQLFEKITGFHKLCTVHFTDFWQVSDSVY